MVNGATAVHQMLHSKLEDYIISQYFGKSQVLREAVQPKLKQEGVLYQRPYIESSPAYQTIPQGIQRSSLPEWMKLYFAALSNAELGVHDAPFQHQLDALEAAEKGKDLFIPTGTGSGKTECFLWPILAKLAKEAKEAPDCWAQRGIRTIIMYPMNALVSDQVSRLRRLIGDSEGKFVRIFRDTCGYDVRRPQFGMYTGRTPYPGPQPRAEEDHRLERTLRRMSFPKDDTDREFFAKLSGEGKIPAKADMNAYLSRLHAGRHIPDEEDAELITRFEMQQVCPDILITNYSMMEYMLLRPREAKIWQETKTWLSSSRDNRLLFVIDEAHMYRGSSGGEVALLIRRLFHKLGIRRDQVQFILTTASMPDQDPQSKQAIATFAENLTAADGMADFSYLTGAREDLHGKMKYDIPVERFRCESVAAFEQGEDQKLDALNRFWTGVENSPAPFVSLDQAEQWMYEHLAEYQPFFEMMNQCRGTAVSLQELAHSIFPDDADAEAMEEVSVLLAIAPIARNGKGAVLFPTRMHMLFRGIRGVYACTNGQCPHSHSDGSLTLGKVFLSDGRLTCPECGCVVYELYNDRRCGALFYKGYVFKRNSFSHEAVYLWHYPGQLMDHKMKEIHLFLPDQSFELPKGQRKNKILPCYLDVHSGFVFFGDDSQGGKPGIRKLYYCDFSAKGRPEVITFPTCPNCRRMLSPTQMGPFSTRGNQSFFNLIQTQFSVQPSVPGKENRPEQYPNEGRKVLLFSDSRQRAARLAKDMSEASDNTAARQLFALAIDQMEHATAEHSLDRIYDYFCLAAGQNGVQMYREPEHTKFQEDCQTVLNSYERCTRRRREYVPRFSITNAPMQMQEQLLSLFSGGYNTLNDAAICWLEPTDAALADIEDLLEEGGISASEEEIIAFFHAWLSDVCDSSTALGHTISDTVRENVRRSYGGYGLAQNWTISKGLCDIMGWGKGDSSAEIWCRVLRETVLDYAQPDNGRLYVDLTRIKPRMDPSHIWYRCKHCSEITPFPLNHRCPGCGRDTIHVMTDEEKDVLRFWRKPVEDALNGERVRVIDTEEHTAQLSHKDQRDEMWSKTEQYELRFQDLIQKGEAPVDILSSTTTMEVGIDIGSLVAVGLRNIPPMRENYQQRAGRAGRRGSSLSTIVTFCEDGPHDTLYFHHPVPMFRGDPRKPWIDVKSEKLLQRHVAMIMLQKYLEGVRESMEAIPAASFLDTFLDGFSQFLQGIKEDEIKDLIPKGAECRLDLFRTALLHDLEDLKEKRDRHPELYGVDENGELLAPKSLLDALYEQGTIPTYSFPKNVVGIHITDRSGRVKYQVDRGLDIAIGEYAPGKAIVVDKNTYQIGGLYAPGSERRKGQLLSPARKFVEDTNYCKRILSCKACGWFGLAEEGITRCPFCERQDLMLTRPMLRPWGFAPRNGEAMISAQLTEVYSTVQLPLYSTLPERDEMLPLASATHIRMACRSNQRIIMMNPGPNDHGFMVCADCGAAFPGDEMNALDDVQRPYHSPYIRSKCRHSNAINVNLGYDFVTDMLVFEFTLDGDVIDTQRQNNLWMDRAAQSLAEALRLVASQTLDIEFTELVTGYRVRKNQTGTYVDIYIYDSLSSGAGYAVGLGEEAELLLNQVETLLSGCSCDSACHKCIKHYRNQHIHGMLDRFAALDLLRWGMYGQLPNHLSLELQWKLLKPLQQILEGSGCMLSVENGMIMAHSSGNRKRITIYPAMRYETGQKDEILVSDAYLRFAKPYAVETMINGMR